MNLSVSTRPAAVAGSFYPGAPATLRATVRDLVGDAPARGAGPKILVVPHAGYVYSGPTAGRGYAALAGVAERIRRVVLVGPAHRVAVRGIAVPTVERFATPLGDVDLDRAALAELMRLPQVVASDRAHAAEHALEVQLPFLQHVLRSFTLVPMVVGDATPAEVAEALEHVWGGDETVIVVSSDLSHYLDYEAARAADAASVRQVLAGGPDLHHEQACGATPLNAALRLARRHGLVPTLIDACNSGDTAGDRDRVVGYAAVAFAAAERADARGAVLLQHARAAIERLFDRDPGPLPQADWLERPGATFVTLRRAGQLRGCIGSLEAERPLREDVAANARAAALRDPRFPPLAADELHDLTVEVSLLSDPLPLHCADEDELVARLAAERPGLILEYRGRRATFLPQVWEQLDDARSFLRQLKQKAGLDAEFWSPDLRVLRYTVDKWSEPA